MSEIGELQPLANVCLSPPKSALLTVHFEEQLWSHRFNLDSTTADVKRLLSEKFIKLPTSAFTVLFNDVGSPFGAESMKHPQHTLRRYGAKDSDELHVQLRARP